MRARSVVEVLLGAIVAFTVSGPVAMGVAWSAESEPAASSQAAGDAQARARARARALAEDDDGGYVPGARYGMGWLPGGRGGLLGTAAMVVAFYFLFLRGRGGGNANWGSYYVFWIVGPLLLAALASHPAILLLAVVGLLLRRWLPDPFLALKHAGRIRSLQVDVAANPGNVTARRDLASLWLEKRRPARALPLVEEALVKDPKSVELLYLRGVSHLYLRQHDRAVDALVSVVHQDPSFRYGEAYLRAADALIALGRWDDAEDALDHYVKINGSSIEGHGKRVRVRKARNDVDGAKQAERELADAWRALPSFQRRKQLGWYLRTRLG